MFRFMHYFCLVVIVLMTMAAMVGCADDDDDTGDDDVADDDVADDDATDDDLADDDIADDDVVPPGFQVGAARVDISPDWPVAMAGYGLVFISENWCRWSEGIHDPIYATALALDDGKGQLIIQIVVDTVGIIITDVEVIQQRLAAELNISIEQIVISATHNHNGPDTIGIWGVLLPPISGRDEDFIDMMIDGSVEAGVQAYANRKPAVVKVAKGLEPNYHFNSQEVVDPQATLDSIMTVLSFTEPNGAPIATLMNWGCHPMVVPAKNKLISADFPAPYYNFMDNEVGGINMFVNGNLGAAVHPYNHFEDRIPEGFADAVFMGRGLADTAQSLLAQATELTYTDLKLVTHEVLGQLLNPVYVIFGQLDLIPRDIPGYGEYGTSTMTAYRLGPVVFGTVPGELVPNLGLDLREIMGGEYQIIENIGQDWLGYIMTEKQYKNLLYIYFSILSVGPNMGELLLGAYEEVFDPANGF